MDLGLLSAYRRRWQRKGLRLRARLRRRDLTLLRDRTATIRQHDILLVCCLRNERLRLPYFLDYYRKMGIAQFLIIDNGSTDGSADYLRDQSDVSLWQTQASYKRARFGVDWQNWLLRRYGHGHWCVTVDVDEFLIYPFCDVRPLRALTDWLDASSIRTLSTMLLDMYPKGPIADHPYSEGQNPFEIASWFDCGNYTYRRNPQLWNLWIQGGPRARAFFPDRPQAAPALNKIALVRWHRSYVYASSTHMLLPRGLNLVYDQSGGEKTSGCLLHAKFLDTLGQKAAEEAQRGEHFAQSREYLAYLDGLRDQPDLWCPWSEEYINWRQLEILGLMSKGNWA